MRRSWILNPLTVTVALAAVLFVGIAPRQAVAMPVKSQAATGVDRDALLERAVQVLQIPEVRQELKANGISMQSADIMIQRLSNQELSRLIEVDTLIRQGEGSTGAAIVIIIGLAALGYLVWRYTKWVDWYQSDLKLRN